VASRVLQNKPTQRHRDKSVNFIPTVIVKVLKEKTKAGIALHEEELEVNFFLTFFFGAFSTEILPNKR